MVEQGSFSRVSEDKGLIQTGMFLQPRIANALRQLVMDTMVQNRAQFTVAKSQVHPNGLCEIVVKKSNPAVSNSAVMEILKQCRSILRDDQSDTQVNVGDLNKTIDLTGDDSICSPSTPYSGRRITFKPTLLSTSPLVNEKGDPFCRNDFSLVIRKDTLLNENTNGFVETLSANKSDATRMVSFKRNNFDTSERIDQFSAEPLSKRSHIVVQVPNNTGTSVASRSNNIRPNCAFSENAVPSTSTWTSPMSSKFPMMNISQKLGAQFTNFEAQEEQMSSSSFTKSNALEDPLPGTSTWMSAVSSKFPVLNISKHLGAQSMNFEEEEKQMSSSTTPLLNVSEDLLPSAPTWTSVEPSKFNLSNVNKLLGTQDPLCKNIENKDRDEIGREKQISSLRGEMLSDTSKAVGKEEATVTGKPLLKKVAKSKIVECTSETNNDDNVVSDDEIIIEKEVKTNTKIPHALIIDDSDDDIAVCEVVSQTSNLENVQKKQKPGLKKKKKKKMSLKSPLKISAGTNFVASTSSVPAPDFIPLNSKFRRIDPKTANYNAQIRKNVQLEKVKAKKLKKAKVIEAQSLRRADSARTQVEDTPSESKSSEKHEFDGNMINPNAGTPKTGLRPVVIDASNVAVGHGRGTFSVAGLKICIKYFTDRGHKVFAITPKFRRFHVSPEDRKVLDDLEVEGVVCYSPSRTMPNGRKVASYDDRFIVQTAAELGGVVVSTDNYRDLLSENEAWRETIEQRLLMFTWIGDMLLFPNDPLGRNGPHLQEFLRFPHPPPKD